MNLIKLQVKTSNHKYPIFIGNGLIYKLSKLLKENSIDFNQCLMVIDTNVPKKFIKKIIKAFSKKKIAVHYFKANELNKNQKNINKILSILLKKNFNRNDCLISIGGGITGFFFLIYSCTASAMSKAF